ncbi:MAG: hypothetical protein KAJ91_04315, partial [Candidatus Aenigmarchaeota archaeon]|nr:hypothetical protein [Candidatus Aenigmarchaeota archaeon]
FSWMAHDTFSVVQRSIEPPYVPETPTAAVIADTDGAAAGRSELYIISLVRYPKNISTVRGWTDISTIEIKNIGDLPVKNISLTLTGVPYTWYTLRPDTTQDLSSGNTTAFLLEFNIPDNADIGAYDLVFTAKGNEASDEKFSQLTIFQSVEEMLLAEILALKIRLQHLEEEMAFAGTAGKNISQVIPVIERAKKELGLAEATVANSSYEEAHNHILLTKNLLDRVEVLLKAARYIEIVPTKIIPPWLIAIIILLAVLAAFAFIWTFRLKRRMKLFFRTPAAMMRAVHLFKKEKESRQVFLVERTKLLRMQDLLEREVKDGTITESAYQELSKRTSDKLKDIDKKIKG